MFAARSKAAEHAVSPARAEGSADVWKQIVEPVQPFLDDVGKRLGEQVEAFDPEIAAYAKYALTNQGKQLRPALVALAAGATGRLTDPHITVAVIIEMVHLATLVHDDIMDAAEIRRRRPTLAANWGNSISVLVGDCLFAHSLQLAASFPTPVVCREVAAATNTVCSGEILQTHRRLNFAVTRADYFKVVAMKTGELFALSCDLGARLNAVPDAQRVALRDYGLALGTAYQVYDDCLDVFGSEADAGKSLGSDLASGKLTLPVLVVLERADTMEREQLKEWITTWRPHYLSRVLALMAKHGALTESCTVIGQFVADAQASLDALPLSESRLALVALTEFLARATESLGKQA
ncbi:MAG: polyprenyl synthetase family protein [Verrucomicrobia bacterium]|nr:polyprenyl synthetase family protein [Verrucomicrobiota bacterium]